MTTELQPEDVPKQLAERRRLAEELKGHARAAFERGELPVATLHACDMLMLFPNERSYLELFDEVVLSTQDPLALFPPPASPVHVATAAGRARTLMMRRRLPEALDHLCQAVMAAPQIPYLFWAQRWLTPTIVSGLPFEHLFETVIRTALTVGVGVPVPPDDGDPRVMNLRAGASVFEVFRGCFPDESILWFGEALLRRRLGEPQDTLRVAREAADRFPSDWRVLTALLNACRDAGQPDEALSQARRAMDLSPDDLSPLHDAAWAFVDAERAADAAPLFEELLRRDPSYPGADACLAYTRWKATGAEADRDELIRMRERRSWDDQSQRFADEADPPVPYRTVLPVPQDPTAAAAREVLAELRHIHHEARLDDEVEVQITARFLDSPSVALAFELGVAAADATGRLLVEAQSVQAPDPRVPKAEVGSPVWRYEGRQPVKVYREPFPRVQEAIARIAREPFRQDRWDPACRALADELGSPGYHPLLATLSHPPRPDDDFDVFTWLWRCQVAIAITLSHLGPWQTGFGRVGLYAMAYGPSDWVTGAALVAFGWRGGSDPAVRQEIEPMFRWLRANVPPEGFTAYEVVLAEVWLGLGGHPPGLRAELEAWLGAHEESAAAKNRVLTVERRYGGLTLEDYARFSVERDRILAAEPGSGELAATDSAAQLPPELLALCERYGVPLRNAAGGLHPYVDAWQEAMNVTPALHRRFHELTQRIGHGSGPPPAASSGSRVEAAPAPVTPRPVTPPPVAPADDLDPEVFPGEPVARLSDYVKIMRGMQTGALDASLAPYGLDLMTYGPVAQAWGAKLAADPDLSEKFTRMMRGG